MHLRSHSSLSQIFTSLSDAASDPRLALSATAIMFMLCQDRLNMDLDRASLKLMVDLLEYDDKAHLENKQVRLYVHIREQKDGVCLNWDVRTVC